MRLAISRRRKSDGATRAGSANSWRTRTGSIGALIFEGAWGETMVDCT